MGTFGGGITVPIGTMPSEGGAVYWILPNNLPNGSDTVFKFNQKPRFCVFNGILQFEGVGYIMSFSSGTWNVTFKDSLGNTITPAVGDDIRAAV